MTILATYPTGEEPVEVENIKLTINGKTFIITADGNELNIKAYEDELLVLPVCRNEVNITSGEL